MESAANYGPGVNYSRRVGGDLMWGGGGEERREFILRSKQSEGKTLVA